MDDIEAKIITNRNIVKDYFLLRLRLARPLGTVVPGQFVMLKIPGNTVFLRRPFSIYDYKRDVMSIMYKVKGSGTLALSNAVKGDSTMVLGPLGRGFNIYNKPNHIVVAGGIGIAGVHLLIKKIKANVHVYYGCTDEKELVLLNDLKMQDKYISTIDGSYGYKGNVIDLFRTRLKDYNARDTQVYACGPEGMLKGLKHALESHRAPCQVLVEERMACGLGLCFGCVKKTLDEKEPYKRVCKEGPVFNLWQICL